MDWKLAAAEWKHFRSEVRSKWGEITESELAAIAGDRVCLVRTIAATYRLTSEQVERQIRSFEARNGYSAQMSSR
jgi:uncharacterized protein YjbJ (UPF0337 family)